MHRGYPAAPEDPVITISLIKAPIPSQGEG